MTEINFNSEANPDVPVLDMPRFQDVHYDEATLNKGLAALSNVEGGGAMALDMVREYGRQMAEHQLAHVDLEDHEFQDAWTISRDVASNFSVSTAVGDLQYEFEDEGISKLSSAINASFAAGVNDVLEDQYPDLDMTHAWAGPSNVG